MLLLKHLDADLAKLAAREILNIPSEPADPDLGKRCPDAGSKKKKARCKVFRPGIVLFVFKFQFLEVLPYGHQGKEHLFLVLNAGPRHDAGVVVMFDLFHLRD